jgi:hypothetical protein
MQGNNFNSRAGEFSLQGIGGAPRHSIVGAQRVSIGDDENSGHCLDFISLGSELDRRRPLPPLRYFSPTSAFKGFHTKNA